MSEDYALVRYKNIPAGFVSEQSSDLIVNAVKDMILDANPIGHHWEWLDSQTNDHIYRSIEPVSGSVHQVLRIRSNEGTVKLTYFNTDAIVEDFDDYDSIDATSQLLEEFDLRGTSEFYNFNNLDYEVSPSIVLNQTKLHRVWLAEYRESNVNPCATENACALTILVEEITDEGADDARFVLGTHVGSIITPVNANKRLTSLASTVDNSTDPPYFYVLSTDAALVGVPSNPNRMIPEVRVNAEVNPSWLGQSTAIDGSWVQLGPSRESLASIGHGSHLPDSYMLSTNGRAKLLPLTTYAKQDRSKETLTENKWTQISASFNISSTFSLALDELGQAWAWGDNFYGQLGIGLFGQGNVNTFQDPPDKNVPTRVIVPPGHPGTWLQISAGSGYSLGIDTNGRGWAWGDNSFGQLGTNTGASAVPVPTPIDTAESRPQTWSQLSAGGGGHSLGIALSPDPGRGWAWGLNLLGQLGDGTLDSKTVPSPITLPTYFTLFHNKPLSTELGRTRYVRQFGTEPLEHGIILISSMPSSQQTWKALGNGSNQVILWFPIPVQVP